MSVNPQLQLHVLLFAGLRDAMQRDHIQVSVPHDTGQEPTVADLLDACATQFPLFTDWLPHIRVAVNLEYSNLETPLAEGDEIAFIPPVAGG